MEKIQGRILIDIQKCKGCGLCEANCPQKILMLQQEVNQMGYRYVKITQSDKCIGCASCGYVCPDSCIAVYKKRNKK